MNADMFDPYKMARDVLASTSLVDPDDIAEAIFDRTPKRSVPAAYRLILRSVAREAIRLSRMEEPAPAIRASRDLREGVIS